MKALNRPIALAALIFSGSSLPAVTYSDDTDIFFNLSPSATTNSNPNVLFIFDTSGSMGADASDPVPAFYKASTDYGGSAANQIYVYDGSLEAADFLGGIPTSDIHCDAMLDHIASDTSERIYAGRVAEWNPGSGTGGAWQDITANSGFHVECLEDSGAHGSNSSPGGNTYAASGSAGPYSASSSNEISWSAISGRRYFVSANYHDYLQNPVLADTPKMAILANVMSNLVQDFDDVTLGMMRFNDNQGGRVIHHFSNAETDSAAIVNAINNLTDGGWTPLSETLLEAHYYYNGSAPVYGGSGVNEAFDSSGNYISPVNGDGSCQSHNIVLISDGAPRLDNDADPTIRALVNDNSCGHVDNSTSAANQCLDELAGYMANDHDYDSRRVGRQGLKIYTVGFDEELEVLEAAAANGNGAYFEATSAVELRTALTEILQTINSGSTTFTRPGVAVNAFNSLQHRDEIYYSLYLPQTDPRWHGNVKKYRLEPDGDITGGNDSTCGTGGDVIGSDGFFLDTAQSCWSAATDGADVRSGGASGELTNARTVYTITDTNYPNLAFPVDLNTVANTLSVDNPFTTGVAEPDNTAVTSSLLGLGDSATRQDRTNLIGWILGQDINNESSTDINHFLADPLHNAPVVVTYDINTSGVSPVYDDVLFSASNGGAFRAIDADNGQEIFAFIPPELLPNQLSYFANTTGDARRYGLDGAFTVRVEESDDPGFSINASGEYAHVYIGMRRGGNNYYALDVTDRHNPQLLWTIQGGIAGSDFEDLGQTWSRMKLAQVNENCSSTCTPREVLIFGGGYDTGYDSSPSVTNPDGAAIYMVDAATGDLLWSAGEGASHTLNINIANSITGDISVVDANGDGIADMLFAVDVLGQVWRIDLSDSFPGTLSSTHAANGALDEGAARITDLAGASSDQQYFYNGPNVSVSRDHNTPVFVITIASGQVPDPLDTSVTDRIYVLFERNIFSAPADANSDGQPDYIAFNASVLNDKTGLTARGSSSVTPADPDSSDPHGYYIRGTAIGEKFLRPSTTFSGITFISSYLPDTDPASSCGFADIGGARLYAINFATGESVYAGAYEDLAQSGIPPQPVILYIDDGAGGTAPVLCVGTECFGNDDDENPLPGSVSIQKTYWRENTP